jgi:hypothetical protein
MFTLPSPPSPQADVTELADFAELLCLEKNQTSAREIVAYLGRVDDNDNNVGCEDDDDENTYTLDEAMNEIGRRQQACGAGYPFKLERAGTTLQLDNTQHNQRSTIYLYLLLSTRLNMKSNRVHDGLDGTHLLEELGAHAIRNYLGGTKARTLVMGTSLGKTFQERVETLCQHTCEGIRFRSLDGGKVTAQDDKLDAVGWVPFADALPGQLVVFGQCKTGTNWKDLVHQLQPDSFMAKWLEKPILVKPVRAFCISEAADRATWKSTCVDAGILLDRCRLVDFSDNVDAGLLARIERWVKAAQESIAVPKGKPKKRRVTKPRKPAKQTPSSAQAPEPLPKEDADEPPEA